MQQRKPQCATSAIEPSVTPLEQAQDLSSDTTHSTPAATAVSKTPPPMPAKRERVSVRSTKASRTRRSPLALDIPAAVLASDGVCQSPKTAALDALSQHPTSAACARVAVWSDDEHAFDHDLYPQPPDARTHQTQHDDEEEDEEESIASAQSMATASPPDFGGLDSVQVESSAPAPLLVAEASTQSPERSPDDTVDVVTALQEQQSPTTSESDAPCSTEATGAITLRAIEPQRLTRVSRLTRSLRCARWCTVDPDEGRCTQEAPPSPEPSQSPRYREPQSTASLEPSTTELLAWLKSLNVRLTDQTAFAVRTGAWVSLVSACFVSCAHSHALVVFDRHRRVACSSSSLACCCARSSSASSTYGASTACAASHRSRKRMRCTTSQRRSRSSSRRRCVCVVLGSSLMLRTSYFKPMYRFMRRRCRCTCSDASTRSTEATEASSSHSCTRSARCVVLTGNGSVGRLTD